MSRSPYCSSGTFKVRSALPEHTTPVFSLWPHLYLYHPLWEQLDSHPEQYTKPKRMFPKPWPKWALPGVDTARPQPSCWQTTSASCMSQSSSHTVPPVALVQDLHTTLTPVTSIHQPQRQTCIDTMESPHPLSLPPWFSLTSTPWSPPSSHHCPISFTCFLPSYTLNVAALPSTVLGLFSCCLPSDRAHVLWELSRRKNPKSTSPMLINPYNPSQALDVFPVASWTSTLCPKPNTDCFFHLNQQCHRAPQKCVGNLVVIFDSSPSLLLISNLSTRLSFFLYTPPFC